MKRFQEWKTSRKWIAGIILFVLLGCIGVFTYTMLKVYQTASTIYKPVERLPSEPRQAARKAPDTQPAVQPMPNAADNMVSDQQDSEPKLFLLVGVDQDSESDDVGRADVIMLVVMNPVSKKLTMVSIPRDTYVEIAGKGYKDKINHSYRFGIESVIATVENFTGMLVHHYVTFNFNGFTKAVDSIGGITLTVDDGVAKELNIQSGTHHLDGRQALEYARFRSDSAGDFGRNDRHQLVLKAVLEEARELRSPMKLQDILNTVGQDVRTDLTFSQIVSLASQASDFQNENIERVKYKAHSERFGPQNLSYVIVTESERLRVMEDLKRAAGISEP